MAELWLVQMAATTLQKMITILGVNDAAAPQTYSAVTLSYDRRFFYHLWGVSFMKRIAHLLLSHSRHLIRQFGILLHTCLKELYFDHLFVYGSHPLERVHN